MWASHVALNASPEPADFRGGEDDERRSGANGALERHQAIDMFTHILLPIDGSELSEEAVQSGIQLAKDINAKITAVYVTAPSRSISFGSKARANTGGLPYTDSRLDAEHYLAVLERGAKEAGVNCDTVYVTANHVYDAIIKTAEEKGCDLILMASHHRRGVQGVLTSSETAKVLTHTKLPVLVFR